MIFLVFGAKGKRKGYIFGRILFEKHTVDERTADLALDLMIVKIPSSA